ncbi:type I restriction-modification system subunit M, partial [Bifidobacterium bifidum]|uniref:type I restriction-modification system subunit M n=1 Tax=Bifidobacterium bifidum TaxID=1681 RepID=UPI0025500045
MNKQQLAAKIWESANKMRSKIEANEYKDYILGFIFYKFLSETEVTRLHADGMGDEDLEELREDDTETAQYVRDLCGYFISYDNLFSTWVAKKGDFAIANVRDALSAFDRNIDPARKRVFAGIFDTLQTGLSKLGTDEKSRSKAARDLIYLIKDIPMDSRQDYDTLGFIYEYLISNFASNAGKKAGEFYTPSEVSQLMSEIVAWHLAGREEINIYDPTSGSGSLLIHIGQAVARRNGNPNDIRYYAQELKENTYNLTRMNLVMRGILPDNIVARNGDTLKSDWPWFDTDETKDETYEPLFVDAVVSNPPYSQNWEPPEAGEDIRFEYGIAPKSKADYAFLLHDLYHLRDDGIMTIVLPHGVLFRGGEEGTIRRNLVENHHIQAIIGLPANIFFGTGIPTIVMVLRKHRDDDHVLIVDASKYFTKEGKNNKLRASDIKRIVDAVTGNRDVDKFSRLVGIDEIRQNDYNLNIPRYVDSSDNAESWDVYSTMFGGIPKRDIDALSKYWNVFPGLRRCLFAEENGHSAKLAVQDVREAVNADSDVKAWEQRKLGEFGSVAMCKRIYKEQTSEQGDVPFFKIGTFGADPDAFISNELFEDYKRTYPYPTPGTLLISAAGSIGRIVEYQGEKAYFQDSNIVWLEHDHRLNDAFLKPLYSKIEWGLEGSTIKRLYNKDLLSAEVTIPDGREQKEIGQFFAKLGSLITLHQRK